ncbi:putative N6-adenine-specific DNA methylase [Natranaerovirga hydrolytica]|uniref:Putative N6-adenine-specific DNA methylase n=1 Tax=Natranaerovirga hydrolytica TaxID=680378 RepID=A0A4V6NFA7_9FIRM|nr:class I SAM-dependent RNA methyltransferase [Natranaerovirga hydrolytica]TCK90491.1 putative N6-adenine-specific DNA methylase [Natranaerovirga hydrolytica]
MDKVQLIAPCVFGVEAVLKREIQQLGYNIIDVEDGRVTFEGDREAICRSNIFLRSAERVLIKVGSFRATSFEELFDKVKALEWENYLEKDSKFWVTKASSIKSKLFSPSDIQSIVKKSIVDRLRRIYKAEWFEETGSQYPIRVFIKKDQVTISIDSSGEALHKRGYRQMTTKAPLSETLASSMIQLTPWKEDRTLIDPFCGSGTIPIEAAMQGANIAPGLNRSFESEDWNNLLNKKDWFRAIDEAHDMMKENIEVDIQGYDIDEEALKAARHNAQLAGVDHLIHFQKRDIKELSSPKKYGFMITNPPYGERLGTKETTETLYKEMGTVLKKLDTWSFFIITSYDGIEKVINKKATKKRKLYNGMLKTNFYQFYGPKPRQS